MQGAIDIGHGVLIAPMFNEERGHGILWKHPTCRGWFPVWLDHRSTGHKLVEGSLDDLTTITLFGSLACPKGCPAHGHIKAGRWDPC